MKKKITLNAKVKILQDKTISGHHTNGTIADIPLLTGQIYEVEILDNFAYFDFKGFATYPYTHLKNVEIIEQY